MESEQQHPPGFFPNLLSVAVFAAIMVGLFFGFTSFYPQLIQHQLAKELPKTTPAEPAPEEPKPQPLFVNGAITGFEIAQISSEVVRGPLQVNKIKGYFHGMKTALIASRNWFDLDRQLFRSRGLAMGVQAAIDTSKPNIDRATLGYQSKLVQEMKHALSVDLDDLLSNNSERQRALENFLNNLRRLYDESTVEISSMNRIVEEAKATIDANISASNQAAAVFDSDADTFLSGSVDDNLDEYLTYRREAEKAKVRGQVTAQILAELKPLNERIERYIDAIEANFEALAAGIKIKPVKGLPLYKE